jgi:hypothetical protein
MKRSIACSSTPALTSARNVWLPAREELRASAHVGRSRDDAVIAISSKPTVNVRYEIK